MGHWRIYPGYSGGSNVPTFGKFLSEFARSNGMRAFVISTHVVDSALLIRGGSAGGYGFVRALQGG